jgi:hypothetical protein
MGRAIRAGSGATDLGGAVTIMRPAIDGNDSLQVRKASRAEASRGVRPCRGLLGCRVAGPAMSIRWFWNVDFHKGRCCLRAIRNVVCFLIACSPASVMAEDQLPSELLLRCYFQQTLASVSDSGKKPYGERSFTKDRSLQLKNGALTWGGNPNPVGNGCKLVDGEIACEASSVDPTYSSGVGRFTARRHDTVRLGRATGEIHVVSEIWTYNGESVEGPLASHIEATLSGVCRTTGQPLF